MNIQFMTAEANGIPTGSKDWRGRPTYKYIPNFTLMLKNAKCEEERKAIEETRDFIESGVYDGFTFEIVYTAKALSVDPYTCEHSYKWQMLQHPWHEDGWTGEKVSKTEMLKNIQEGLDDFTVKEI